MPLRSATQFACCILVALMASRASADAQSRALTPEGLASAWTGTSAPICSRMQETWITPRGTDLIVWRRGTETWDSVEVSGQRYPDGQVHHVVWARRMTDSVTAEAFGDSLGRALTSRGLSLYACAWGGRVWLAPGLAVYFSIGALEKPAGTHRAAVQVVDDPTAIPTVFCPNLPKLARPVRRSRAADRIGQNERSGT